MSFQTLGLHPSLLEVLSGLGISQPSPLQKLAVPSALSGRDVVIHTDRDGGAESRESAAYLLPVLDRLHGFTLEPGGEARAPRALVVVGEGDVRRVADAARAIATPLGLTVAEVAQVDNPEDFDLLIAPPATLAAVGKSLARVLGKLRELVIDGAEILSTAESGKVGTTVTTWLSKLAPAGRRTTVIAHEALPPAVEALLENPEFIIETLVKAPAEPLAPPPAAPPVRRSRAAKPKVAPQEAPAVTPIEAQQDVAQAEVPVSPEVIVEPPPADDVAVAAVVAKPTKAAPKRRSKKALAEEAAERDSAALLAEADVAVQIGLPMPLPISASDEAPQVPAMVDLEPKAAMPEADPTPVEATQVDGTAPSEANVAPATPRPNSARSTPLAPEAAVSAAAVAAMAIPQAVFEVSEELKPVLLAELIERAEVASAVAFLRTKHRANRLADFLARRGVACDRIHGNRTPAQRHLAVQRFRDGKVKVLVATDVAARGLDLETLPCVVNFDLPVLADDYRNRIGRTAGTGSVVEAMTFASADEANEIAALERELGGTLPRRVLEGFDLDQAGEELEIPLLDRHNKPQVKAAPKPQAARPPRSHGSQPSHQQPSSNASRPAHERRPNERQGQGGHGGGQPGGHGGGHGAQGGGGSKPPRRKRSNKRGGGGGQPSQTPIPRGTYLPNGEFQPPPSLLPERPPSGIRGKRSISRF